MLSRLLFRGGAQSCRWGGFQFARATQAGPQLLRATVPKLRVTDQVRTFAQRRYKYERFGRAQQLGQYWRAYPLFRVSVYSAGGGGVLFYVTHIEEVPISGRRRFNFVSPQLAAQMGQQAYLQTLQQYQGRILPDWAPEAKMARRVLERLIPSSGITGEWELHVVKDDMANAFVLPGNKVFVMTGILPLCRNEDGLATVLGHEIAHNVAQHAAERMSQFSILFLAALAFSAIFDVSGSLSNLAVDLVFSRPGSRRQESEADHIGLLMMAASCFNPDKALDFWKRMEKYQKVKPPQFLSTHPSEHNRFKKLQEWLPEAMSQRANSNCGYLSNQVDNFRQALPREVQQAVPRRVDDDDFF